MNEALMTWSPASDLHKNAAAILRECRSGLTPSDACLEALEKSLTACDEVIADRTKFDNAIERAREEYAGDDIEIDDLPVVSPFEAGVWVSAWVWVQAAAADDDSESGG